MANPKQEFDLHALSASRSQRLLPVRVLLLVIMVVIGGAEVVYFLRSSGLLLGVDSGADAVSPLTVSGGVVILAFCAIMFVTEFSARSPISCAIGDSGIEFRRPNGQSQFFRWEDRRLRLTLIESAPIEPSKPGSGSSRQSTKHWELRETRPRYTPLSESAFSAILAECRRRELDVGAQARGGVTSSQTLYHVRPGPPAR